MGPEGDRLFQRAGNHCVPQLSPDAAGLHPVDDPCLHKVDDGGMFQIDHRAGRKPQAPDSQLLDCGEHLAYDLVSLPEVVVEGDGHAVLQSGL